MQLIRNWIENERVKKKGLMTYYRDIFKFIVTEQPFFVNSVVSVVGIKEANTVLCV